MAELSGKITSADYRRLTHQDAPGTTIPALGLLGDPYAEMNKLERAYAVWLDKQREGGEVAAWWFGAIKLRLADRTWYTPDFLVQSATGLLEFVECKGHWREDARVKWKVCADLYPQFRWQAVQMREGQWVHEEYRGGKRS